MYSASSANRYESSTSASPRRSNTPATRSMPPRCPSPMRCRDCSGCLAWIPVRSCRCSARTGTEHLAELSAPGFAFGGSCLPKDLRSLLHLARMNGADLPLLAGTLATNELVINEVVDRVASCDSAHAVALLGLSFKTNTDDLRESPNVELAERLIGKGFDVQSMTRSSIRLAWSAPTAVRSTLNCRTWDGCSCTSQARRCAVPTLLSSLRMTKRSSSVLHVPAAPSDRPQRASGQ